MALQQRLHQNLCEGSFQTQVGLTRPEKFLGPSTQWQLPEGLSMVSVVPQIPYLTLELFLSTFACPNVNFMRVGIFLAMPIYGVWAVTSGQVL